MSELPKEVFDKLSGYSLDDCVLKVVYRNYEEKVGNRRIIPLEVYFGSNEYHKEEQWLMKVWDLDKNALRDYALKDIIKYGWD